MTVNRSPVQGIPVFKTAQALPATTTSTLYTVAGGAVLITGLFGKVTTVCSGTATTLALGSTASSTTSIATALAITSKAVGTWFVPQGAAGIGGTPLVLTGPAFVLPAGIMDLTIPFVAAPFLLNTDALTWTTSATNTGIFSWYLWYVPLDAAATVS